MNHNRREFLADVGKGMLVASVGPALAAELGLSTVQAADGPDRLTFGDREPLVSLLQDTPAAKLLPILADKVPKRISFAEAKHQVAVYRNLTNQPSLYDARKPALEIFDKGEAFIVVPIGRLLEELAIRLRELIESRNAEEPPAAKAKKVT